MGCYGKLGTCGQFCTIRAVRGGQFLVARFPRITHRSRMPASSQRPVTVAGVHLTAPRHICCFFDSREEQYEVVTPYLLEGMRNNEDVMVVMDGEPLDDCRSRLSAAGVSTTHVHSVGQMCLRCSTDVYLAEGAFSKERMIRLLEEKLKEVSAGPFAGLRTCADMLWAHRAMPKTQELLEYESEVNSLLDVYDATFMCIYDASKISGRMLLDVLGTHSHVVIGKEVKENPYYMKPADYKRTMYARRSTTSRTMDW